MNDPEECFAYAEHLHHEHHRLNRLLLEINREVAQVAGSARSPSALSHLSQGVADLRKQLQAHYAEEEAGGCLEEAVTRCPSLASDTKTILEEHPVLDQMLDHLLAVLAKPAAAPADVQQTWRAFYTKIQRHEAAETRLLQIAFGSDTAELDVESAD